MLPDDRQGEGRKAKAVEAVKGWLKLGYDMYCGERDMAILEKAGVKVRGGEGEERGGRSKRERGGEETGKERGWKLTGLQGLTKLEHAMKEGENRLKSPAVKSIKDGKIKLVLEMR